MAIWQVTLTRTNEVSFEVESDDVEAWWPELRRMSGDPDEVFMGTWADRLLVDWETKTIQDGDEPLGQGLRYEFDQREGAEVSRA